MQGHQTDGRHAGQKLPASLRWGVARAAGREVIVVREEIRQQGAIGRLAVRAFGWISGRADAGLAGQALSTEVTRATRLALAEIPGGGAVIPSQWMLAVGGTCACRSSAIRGRV